MASSWMSQRQFCCAFSRRTKATAPRRYLLCRQSALRPSRKARDMFRSCLKWAPNQAGGKIVSSFVYRSSRCRDHTPRERGRLHLLRSMRRNSQLQDRARIETVNEVDLGLRAPQLHGDGDTTFMPLSYDTRTLSEEIRTLHEKRVDAKAKTNMESRK